MSAWQEQFEKFCANLLIDSKEQGTIPLTLNGCQKHFVKEVAEGLERGVRHFVILKGRQEGISTICLALDLFWAFKHPGLQGGVITDTDSNKEKFRETLTRYHTSLPKHFKIPATINNRYQIAFKNRSDIQYMVAGIRTGGNLGRAKALNFLHATECSSWADEEGLASLQSSLAEKSSNRLYIWESTARGFDLFYDMCQTAKRAVSQKFIFIAWWLKEDYCFKEDEQEYQVYWESASQLSGYEREALRKVKQYYGVTITPGQIAWYRWHLAEKKNGDEMWMKQEYPFDEDEAFVVAGSQFFTSERLTNTYLSAKRERYDSYRYVTGSEFQFTQLHRTNAQNADLKVWEEPRAEGIYVIGADPAYGSSDNADRFAACVFRCYADKLIQVAEYCSPDINTAQFAWILAHIGGAYKRCILNLEITGPGGAVATELVHLQRSAAQIPMSEGKTLLDVMGHIRHYFWMRPDSQFIGQSKSVHTKMDEYTKRAIMNSYRDSFEVGRMEVRSVELVNEMRTIVQGGGDSRGATDQGRIAAGGRAKDDRVIAAALANWVWIQSVKTQLMAQKMTYATVQRSQQNNSSIGHMQRHVFNYLKASGIGTK
jgi:hypothetical protein